MPASLKLPAHTLPADRRTRRIRPYSRAEWRRRLHRVPAGILRRRHLVIHRMHRRATEVPAAR